MLIYIYRSFASQNNITIVERFTTQIRIINNTINKYPNHQILIMGDFNLNYYLANNNNYNYKNLFDIINEMATVNNLTQIINFPTWSRVVNGVKKESILDHVYVNYVTMIAITPPQVKYYR